ncbi:acetyltransferase [Chryseobacterium sp. JAH]|uniref:acetyltransferase n=1 Tax=Chryseobacterium sp. JAH TaxID=1742858 RepID=UPI000741116F|nr:acetyltransferase [Chryseobacterium sp. JAH]KUJ50603.1 acetyltransferase [Chryseobacterium sp. JAH]
MLEKYGLISICQLIIFKIRTYFIFSNARLIRFPFRLRGKKFISVDDNFTTGYNCRIDAFSLTGNKKTLIRIGKNVQINDDVHIAAVESIYIGDDVLIASKVYISDHNHGSYKGKFHDSPTTPPNSRKIYSDPVRIERNVWLGEFVCVLQGVTIGEGSIIGAMSVVSKNIPAHCIAVGSPAKVIKVYDFNLDQWINVNR